MKLQNCKNSVRKYIYIHEYETKFANNCIPFYL